MKKSRLLLLTIAAVCIALTAAACSPSYTPGDNGPDSYGPSVIAPTLPDDANEFNEIEESPFVSAAAQPASAFSMDANTAAYANLRRYINQGLTINKNMIRTEELVNYFSYDYAAPDGFDPLAVNGTLSPCPWNDQSNLLTVSVKAKDLEFSGVQNNLVFLLDVSGSMDQSDKMPLMQAAFCMLTENLNDNDYVSIVTYAGSNKTVLDGARGTDRKRIQNAIEDLMAGGGTAGAAGLQSAYTLAEKYFIEGGNNRIILATDGDFNVGISSQGGLESFITEKRASKVGLTVLGFGYGNLKDNKLETIAKAAFEGNYAYIDTVNEARKVLVDEIGGTLVTVARDVKAQVEFNPAKVDKYRLIGYENKRLTQEEWDDPETVAGDIGAGHCVTAVYEVVLKDSPDAESSMAENWLKISVRYKDPVAEPDDGTNNTENADDTNREIVAYVDTVTEDPNDDIKFISAVVETALVLRNSAYKGTASFNSVLTRLRALKDGFANDPYKTEFVGLVEKLQAK